MVIAIVGGKRSRIKRLAARIRRMNGSEVSAYSEVCGLIRKTSDEETSGLAIAPNAIAEPSEPRGTLIETNP